MPPKKETKPPKGKKGGAPPNPTANTLDYSLIPNPRHAFPVNGACNTPKFVEPVPQFRWLVGSVLEVDGDGGLAEFEEKVVADVNTWKVEDGE